MYLGVLHKQVPEQAGTVVFYHYHNGALVYCQVRRGKPQRVEVKGILKAIIVPNFIAQYVVEKFHCLHALVGGIRKRGQCSCWGYYAHIVIGRAGGVAKINIAGGKSPAMGRVSGIAAWVGYTVGVVNAGMCYVLLPVVGVLVGQLTRIEAQKRVMGKKQGAASVFA